MLSFSDKIMVTISQEGRLAQWVPPHLSSKAPRDQQPTNVAQMQVKMDASNPARGENYLPAGEDDLLPMSSLTATTLLGGGHAEREMAGQLYASQIASLIVAKNPDEGRTLLVGLGLNRPETSRTQYFDLLELVTRCL